MCENVQFSLKFITLNWCGVGKRALGRDWDHFDCIPGSLDNFDQFIALLYFFLPFLIGEQRQQSAVVTHLFPVYLPKCST